MLQDVSSQLETHALFKDTSRAFMEKLLTVVKVGARVRIFFSLSMHFLAPLSLSHGAIQLLSRAVR